MTPSKHPEGGPEPVSDLLTRRAQLVGFERATAFLDRTFAREARP